MMEAVRPAALTFGASGMPEPQRLAVDLAEVKVTENGITVTCATAAIVEALGVVCDADASAAIALSHTARLTRAGRAMRLVQDDGATPAPDVDALLVTFITRARSWWATLREGELDITRLATREGVSASYMSCVLRLTFLSPKVVEAVLAGRRRAGVDVKMLTLESPPATSWRAQEEALLPV